MNISPCVSSASPYEGHRFPAEIISHCVWLYFRFSLSFRDVEEMMASAVSWSPTKRFGNGVRSSDSRTPNACVQGEGHLGDRWHLDEVFLKIQGKLQYLWRAVDQDGDVLDILVRRDGTNGPPRSSFASY